MIDPNSTFTIDLFALIVMQGPAASTIHNDDEDSEYSDEKSAQRTLEELYSLQISTF